MRRCFKFTAPLLALALLFSSGAARAFQRSRHSEDGACLWWDTRLVTVYLHEDCSVDVPRQNCENAVWIALDAWNQPTCSDFRFVSGGTTTRTDVGFDEDNWNDNINLIIWHESAWIHEAEAIAMTTTTYDTQNGKIVDSDVELNGRDYTFTTAESAQVLVDICNALAHEAGHMLGLDHSSDSDTTMYGYAPQGETKKCDLSQDDIDGLCHVYPAGRETPPTPGYKPPVDDSGCVCAAQVAPGWSSSILFIYVLFLLLRCRRRLEDRG